MDPQLLVQIIALAVAAATPTPPPASTNAPNSLPTVVASPTPNSLFAPTTDNAVVISDYNDNCLLGLINGTGNDLGFTHGLELNYVRRLPNNKVFTVDLNTSLFTRHVDDAGGIDLNKVREEGHKYNIDIYEVLGTWETLEGKYPIQILDLTQLKVTFQKGNRLYYRVGLGLDMRETDPNGFTPGESVQDWWHRTLGIYQHAYIPPEGQPSQIGVGKTEDGRPVIKVTDAYAADPQLENLSHYSVNTVVAVGARAPFLAHRCEMQAEVGGVQSSEGTQAFGPNTFLNANVKVKVILMKASPRSKRVTGGTQRLNLELGGSLFYFPQREVGEPREPLMGSETAVGIESFHGVGKRKNTLQPFFIMYFNGGRTFNHHMNDPDAIEKFGIRFNF